MRARLSEKGAQRMKQSILIPKEFKRKVSYAFDTLKMSVVFNKDVKRIIGYFDGLKYDSEAQFLMRTMVRTVVESTDALIFRIRELTRDVIRLRGVEKELLPKPKNKTNLRYIFKQFALALNSSFEIKEDDEKLKDYSEARDIRDRITHPKNLSDLGISATEYEKIADTYTWFNECLRKVIDQSKGHEKPQNH
jgi:hypothetical protein